MKQVRFELNGNLSVAGRLASDSAISRRVGASHAAVPWWDAPSSNTNFAPDALPDTGLLSSTRVRCPAGLARLDELAIGDLVLDHTGNETPVLSVTAAGKARAALRLRAPYFSLDQDLIVGEQQCLWMNSDRAEQMFGHENILMPVWALKDPIRVNHTELGPRDVLLEVKLASGNALMVGGCAVATRPATGAAPDAYALSESEARGFSTIYRAGFFRT